MVYFLQLYYFYKYSIIPSKSYCFVFYIVMGDKQSEIVIQHSLTNNITYKLNALIKDTTTIYKNQTSEVLLAIVALLIMGGIQLTKKSKKKYLYITSLRFSAQS